jgi:hypothetical protein
MSARVLERHDRRPTRSHLGVAEVGPGPFCSENLRPINRARCQAWRRMHSAVANVEPRYARGAPTSGDCTGTSTYCRRRPLPRLLETPPLVLIRTLRATKRHDSETFRGSERLSPRPASPSHRRTPRETRLTGVALAPRPER